MPRTVAGPWVGTPAMMGSVDVDERGRLRMADKVMTRAEDVIYFGIAALLVVASGVLLVVAVDELLDVLDGLGPDPVVEVLDTLLLLFIFVELLSAVRATVATPGSWPSRSCSSASSRRSRRSWSCRSRQPRTSAAARSSRISCGRSACSAVVVLLLGITAWLLRLKEREPEEADD